MATTPDCTTPATEETPCCWCGGDRPKSMMHPAFCIDCVAEMLRGGGEERRDLYRPVTSIPPASEEPAPATELTLEELRAMSHEELFAPRWAGDRDGQGFKDATRHLRDLIEHEVYYPTNVLAVLRELPAATLSAVEDAFERMCCEREAIAAQRRDRGL